MKQIAYIGFALVPLLAGCASSTLGPPVESEAKPSHNVAALHAQVRKLGRRVSALNRRVKSQASRSPDATAERANGLQEIEARLADLESAARAADDTQPTIASLAEQLAALSRRVDAQASQQPQLSAAVTDELDALKKRLAEVTAAQTSSAPGLETKQAIADLAARVAQLSSRVESQAGKPPQVAAATTRSLQALTSRLEQLEAAQRTTAARSETSELKQTVTDMTARLTRLARRLDQRDRSAGSSEAATRALSDSLARLEAAQKKGGSELQKMQSDLDKDRTLVIDFLEDLDKRIEDLENSVAAPGTPPQPSAPAPPATPAPASPTKP